MKVKYIKDVGLCKKGIEYLVLEVYIADKHSDLGDSVMELMYCIDEGDGDSCGYSASFFNVVSDLSSMKPLFNWQF